MANAYKYRPQYTQNTIGPDPSGPDNVSGERVGKVLERVAREIVDTWVRNAPNTLGVLEERLGPLLRAGQAMQDRLAILSDEVGASEAASSMTWDAALAALEREPGHEKAG